MFNSIIHTQVRDDNDYIDEWVDYHLALGFEHIVMIDHLSIVPVKERNHVTVIRVDREQPFPYLEMINNTLKNFKTNWLSMLSVDEFIALYLKENINEYLIPYENYGGVSLNWSVYGSSGHEKKQSLVKDNYLWRMPHDIKDTCQDLVKTIIRTEYCTGIHNDHTCRSSKDIVNEDFEICNAATTRSSRASAKINHYITRSKEDWQHKIDRAARAKEVLRTWDGFYGVDNYCTVYDDVLKDYGKPKIWDHIDGWFNFQALYTDMVGRFNDAVFVEIGTWEGKSTVFMADKIKNSGRNIKFYAIDLFAQCIIGGATYEADYEKYLKNIEPVKDYITTIKGDSHKVYEQFEDKSIDFLFIDGNHDYESVKKDIELWLPKVKGVIAGHDFPWTSVSTAVREIFGDVKMIPHCGCWVINLQ